RDRDHGAGVQQLPRRGQRGARGEVAGRQRGGDGRSGIDRQAPGPVPGPGGAGGGRGERLDVGGIEVVDVVHARGAELRRERDAPGTAQLVAVHAQAETGGGAGAQHPLRLFGVEGALFAEDVDPAYVRGDGGEHLPADQVHVVVGVGGAVPAAELARHQVRAEEGRLVELAVGDQGRQQLRGPGLVGDGETVSGLRLERGGAAGDGVRDPAAHQGAQALVGGGTGGVGGDA